MCGENEHSRYKIILLHIFTFDELFAAPTGPVPHEIEDLPLIKTVTISRSKPKVSDIASCQTVHEFAIEYLI